MADESNGTFEGTGIRIPREIKIMDQKYCLACLSQMIKVRRHHYRCPDCGEEADFEEADEGLNC